MRVFKKIISAVLTAAVALTLFTGTVVTASAAPALDGHTVKAATDSAFSTVLGKSVTETYKGQLSNVFTYGASGFSANFTGTDFWMYVPDMPYWDNAYINDSVMVLVDTDMPMEATKINLTQPGWVCLASGLEEGVPHSITVYKSSRGFYGFMASQWLAVSHIATNGSFKTPDPVSDLVIEVYGDSITNGDAVWLNEDGTNSAYTYGSYSAVVGRLLGAESRICGNTGNGLLGWVMATPGNGEIENRRPPQNSWNIFDPNYRSSSWSHEGANAADVVIINLGTNDRLELGGGDLTDTAFENEYIRFIKQIKTDCPDAIVICTIGAMGLLKGDNYEVDFDRIVNESNAWAGEEFTFFIELQKCNDIIGGAGYDNGHPSNVAHEIYAMQMATLINEKLELGIDLYPSEDAAEDLNLTYGNSYDCSSKYDDSKDAFAAFDSNTGTYWQASGEPDGEEWVQIGYTQSVELNKLVIDWNGIAPTETCKVLYSDNGADWNTAAEFNVTDTDKTIVTFDAINAKYLRVVVNGSNNDKYNPEIVAIEAYLASEDDDVALSKTGAQMANGDSRQVRLLAAIADPAAYAKVGFEVTVSDADHTGTNTTEYLDKYVYNSIAGITAADAGVNEDGKMFCLTITDMPKNTVLKVKAVAVTLDGEKVYGEETIISVANGVMTVRK